MDNETIVKKHWFDVMSDLAIAKALIADLQRENSDLRKKIESLRLEPDEPDPQP